MENFDDFGLGAGKTGFETKKENLYPYVWRARMCGT